MSISDISPQRLKFSNDIIKGRIAETLIEELFISMEYSVNRFGMENTVPGLTKELIGKTGEIPNFIRSMPDFIVKDKDGNLFFIEVKYRWNGIFTKKNVKGEYPYHDVFFIVLSKSSIKCITLEELKNGKEINQTSDNFLGNRPEFSLNKNTIGIYCNIAKKIFENI